MAEKVELFEERGKCKNGGDSVDEIAAELAGLAKELAGGELTISGERVPVAEPLCFTVKKRLRKGVLSCEVVLRSGPESSKQKNSRAGAVSTPAAQAMKKGGAPGGKKLKKEIGRLWKEVVKLIAAQSAPPAPLASELLRACEEYCVHADKQWFDMWRQCCDEVRAALSKAAAGDFAQAREKVEEVNRLTKECHKVYK